MDFLDHTLEDFREYLKENTDSKNTVKNYCSDLRIFLIFLDSRHSPITAENFPLFLNTQTLTDFSQYLSVINPPATLNRRISSVKKFFDYYMEHHPLPAPISTPPPVTFSSPISPRPIAEIIDPVEPDTNDHLLRLLPEEVTNFNDVPPVKHQVVDTPPRFIKKYSTQIICTISFLVGFIITMAVYPLLYP